MKTTKCLLTIIGTFLVLLFVISSCSTSKITAVSCPEFPGYKYNKVIAGNKVNRNKPLTAHYRVKTRKLSVVGQMTGLTRKNQVKDIVVLNNLPLQKNLIVPSLYRIDDLSKIEYSRTLVASVDNSFIPLEMNILSTLPLKKAVMTRQTKNIIANQSVGCDTIVLKSGSFYIGKVEEIGVSELKYRRCDNLNGPIFSLLKSDISIIKYSNGTREVISSVTDNIPVNNAVAPSIKNGSQKFEPLGIAGLISDLIGMFIAGILLGLVGIVLGIVSLVKIKNNPGRFRGKGFAIASMILGFMAIAGAIITLIILK
jgi:hypothetical protein